MDNDDLSIPDFLDRKKTSFRESATPIAVSPIKIEAPVKPTPTNSNTAPVLYRSTQSKTSAIIATIEGMLDDKLIDEKWSLYDFLITRDASVNVAQVIIDVISPRAEEMIEVLCTLDDDLLYAYRHLTKEQIVTNAKVLAKLVEDAEQYIDNKKRVRKPRGRTRRIKAEKVVKHLQYAQNYEKFKLVSIDPTRIVGASELWTYNVSNSVITVYRAAKNRVLTLRRGIVIDYDDTMSFGKRIGRHTEEVLQHILQEGKRTLKDFLEQVKTERLEAKRITKQTILLRVF